MIRSSFAAAIGLGLIILGSYACGGDKPPPVSPETPSMDDAGGGSSTMESTGDAGGGAAAEHHDAPAKPEKPAALALPSDAAKLKVKGKKAIDLEIKADGTVHSGGKPAGKVSGMELQDKDGKTQLKVDADGAITTGDGAAYAKFEGDDLTALTGAKWSIEDDGNIASTDDKGKKTSLGKAENVGAAKRTALLAVAYSMWGTKAPAPAAAKGEKKAGGEKKK